MSLRRRRQIIKSADALFNTVSMILHENDSINPTLPRAAVLPAEWRAPLVRVANTYKLVRGA